MYKGDPVHGEVHSSDASGGVEIVLYRAGTASQRVVGPNEYLDIHFVQLVSAPGGDCSVHVGPDASRGAGESVIRGTVAATGGIVSELTPPYEGIKGGKPWVIAPAGVVDAILQGCIRTA